MKHYYITTEPQMILSDEEVTKGDNYIDDVNTIRVAFTDDRDYWLVREDYKKIIAGLPNQPTIDYSALSDEDCKVIGLINERYFTEIFYDLCKSSYPTMDNWAESIEYEKFKTSQSLNDKKWSDNDVKCAMYAIYDETLRKIHQDINCDKFIDNHIQLLSQPKVFEIEAIVQDNKVKILRVL